MDREEMILLQDGVQPYAASAIDDAIYEHLANFGQFFLVTLPT